MKRLIWLLTVLGLSGCITVVRTIPEHGSCPSGCTEYQGNCACELPAYVAPSVMPGNEKPPRNQIPAWQSGDVKAETPSSLAAQDYKADQERKDADEAGKRAAGL